MSKTLYDYDAECEALGLALNSGDDLNFLVTTLLPEDFHDSRNKLVFNAILTLSKASIEKIDTHKVQYQLGSDLANAGGISYLWEIEGNKFGMDLPYICKNIKKYTRLRKILEISTQISQELIHLTPIESEKMLKIRSHDLYEILTEQEHHEPLRVDVYARTNAMYQQALDNQTLRNEGKEIWRGHSTGFIDLDKKILGLSPGHLIIIGARPGQGKTSLLVHLAKNMKDLKVAIFSLEMMAEELATKLLLSIAKVGYQQYSSGFLDNTAIHKLYDAQKKLSDYPLIIDDRSGLCPAQLFARCKRIKASMGLDIVFVDYLQLMNGDDPRYENNQTKVASVSRALKRLAKDLNIPVVALAQVNRNPDKEGKDPSISDLRESGAIEADADQIWLLHHSGPSGEAIKPGVLKVIVGKNRFGEKGAVGIGWLPEIEHMFNLQKGDQDEEDEKKYVAKATKIPDAFSPFDPQYD